VVITFIDVTSLAQAEIHQRTLIEELNHRVKNMLTVAISIAEQTFKSTKSPEAFKDAYIDRLRAMSRSYELLSRENWTDAAVAEIIEQELMPFGDGRFTAEGPEVRLKPAIAMSVGMILHELATNAGKYGALSVPTGRVALEWSLKTKESSAYLALTWKEIDGPQTAEPKRRGFGMKLIEREVGFSLGGNSSCAFEKSGFLMAMEFPLF
jgi:two-component system CheB/CheR fusion protein